MPLRVVVQFAGTEHWRPVHVPDPACVRVDMKMLLESSPSSEPSLPLPLSSATDPSGLVLVSSVESSVDPPFPPQPPAALSNATNDIAQTE